MGRAYEVRKASIQKNGMAKAKIYSNYAKEIYIAAKKSTDIDNNDSLKRLVEKAKKEQVPGEIINRAIKKVSSNASEDYKEIEYEGFGPGGSTLIVKCLTDNPNRSNSDIRPAFNKTNSKIGGINSVSYNYDHLSIVGIKKKDEEEILNLMIENDIDIDDIETEDGVTYIYGQPNDLFKIKKALEEKYENISYEEDEITKIAKEKIELQGEDLDNFKKLINMLNEVEDVQTIYHNVKNV